MPCLCLYLCRGWHDGRLGHVLAVDDDMKNNTDICTNEWISKIMDEMTFRPLAYPIAELPSETGVPRSQIYQEIRNGRLVTFKVGGRRYARFESVMQWMIDLESEE